MQNKTAQQLKRRHKARRLVNDVTNSLVNKSPFRKVIKDLDVVDKKVRKEAEDLNYFLGMAKSFYRRKDYMTAGTYLGKFHEKARLIDHQLQQFKASIPEEKQREFLLKKFDHKDKKFLLEYDPEANIGNKADDGLISTAAGLGKSLYQAQAKDWWRIPGRFKDLYKGFVSERGRDMRTMEKNFSVPFFKKLKEDTEKMIESSESIYDDVLDRFHRMGSAWARRDVGSYIQDTTGFNEIFSPYHDEYIKYHKNNIVPMKELQERKDKEREAGKSAKPSDRKFLEMPDPFPGQPGAGGGVTPPPGVSTNVPSLDLQPASPVFEGPPSKPQGGSVPSLIQAPAAPPSSSQNVHQERTTGRYPFFTNTQPANDNEDAPFSFSAPVGPKEDTDDLVEYELTKRKPPTTPTKAHQQFIERIEKLSTDHEIIKEILSYSEEVEKYSEEESLKLLAVAEGLIEKDAAAKKKTVKDPKKPKAELEPVVVSEPYPPSDPPTENLEAGPQTQRSINVGPETRKITEGPSTLPAGSAPVVVDLGKPGEPGKPGDLLQQLHQNKFKPVEHGIPMGSVKKRWFEIPFLARIRPESIRVSPNTANSLFLAVVKQLDSHNLPYDDEDPGVQLKFIDAFKRAMTQGQLESNAMCNENKDCLLQIFSFIKLEQIDPHPAFMGQVLTFTATCRLAKYEGHVTINKITNVKIQDVSQ